jgi:hypothetical protein
MICESCRESLATVHLTEVEGRSRSETHLCEPCATKKGLPLTEGRPVAEAYALGSKVDQAFDAAWSELANPSALDKLALARRFFVAGARAFSTMPLCPHGAAAWAGESCGPCEAAGGSGEFPGYNRPFGLGPAGPAGPTGQVDQPGPQGLLPGELADLRVEHEALRMTLLNALIKVGVLSQERANPKAAPWDVFTLLRFAGLWLSDAMPWVKQGATHRQLASAVAGLVQRLSRLEAKVAGVPELEEVVEDVCRRLNAIDEERDEGDKP